MCIRDRKGIDREEHGAPLLPNSRQHLSGAKYTLRIMEQAPVTIFVFNTLGDNIFAEVSQEERVFEICNHQSVSAVSYTHLFGDADIVFNAVVEQVGFLGYKAFHFPQVGGVDLVYLLAGYSDFPLLYLPKPHHQF